MVKLQDAIREYKNVLIVGVDNVGSNQVRQPCPRHYSCAVGWSSAIAVTMLVC